ncbi:Ubiquitin-conjugating enzyme, E2 [Cynara cardunculus var. scolymus]|uniref:Ubiquitin-conjugating enzyme, E2 n=1 Tax=Cynara cardunculus var. scolymus TaxID=59895 RepID=A0A118K124_CYNCS|nr:Ubiquitin-conjugating enzyme, E2 [Cynara cardunculus var. scolymus]
MVAASLRDEESTYFTLLSIFHIKFSRKSKSIQKETIFSSIQALLSAPNPDDPLSENIAKHWKTDEADAVETAKEWTHLYASGT